MGQAFQALEDQEEARTLSLLTDLFAFLTDAEFEACTRYFQNQWDARDSEAVAVTLPPLASRPGAQAMNTTLAKFGADSYTSVAGDALLGAMSVLMNMPAPDDKEWLAMSARRIDAVMNHGGSTANLKSKGAYEESVGTTLGDKAANAFALMAIVGTASDALQTRVGKAAITSAGARLSALALATKTGALQRGGRFLSSLTTGSKLSARGLATRGAFQRLAPILSKVGWVGWASLIAVPAYQWFAGTKEEQESLAVDE